MATQALKDYRENGKIERAKLSKIILDCDFLDDPKLVELEAAQGDAGVLGWLFLVTKLAREPEGISERTCLLYFHRRGIEDSAGLLKTCLQLELLRLEGNAIFNDRISREQELVGIKQENWRERQSKRRHASVTRESRVSHAGVTETPEQEQEQELSKDQPKDNTKARKTTRSTVAPVLTPDDIDALEIRQTVYNSQEVRGALKNWLSYKRDRGEHYRGTRGILALLTMCSKSRLTPESAIFAIEYSISRNWMGVHWNQDTIKAYELMKAARPRIAPPPSHESQPEEKRSISLDEQLRNRAMVTGLMQSVATARHQMPSREAAPTETKGAAPKGQTNLEKGETKT